MGKLAGMHSVALLAARALTLQQGQLYLGFTRLAAVLCIPQRQDIYPAQWLGSGRPRAGSAGHHSSIHV